MDEKLAEFLEAIRKLANYDLDAEIDRIKAGNDLPIPWHYGR